MNDSGYIDIAADDGALLHALSASRVVMMCGVSGSGKTWLADRLCTLCGFRKVSADDILWELHGPSFPSLPEDTRRRIFASLGGELIARTDSLLAEGCSVVVDSTMCRRSKRVEMREYCRSRGIEPLLVWLTVPKDQLTERLARRRGNGPDDQIVTPAQLDAYLAGFEAPAPDERPFRISRIH